MKFSRVSSIIFCVIIFLTILPGVSISYAAKPLNRAPKSSGTVSKATVSTTGYSSVKLSRATNSIVITFKNLDKVSKIGYTLSYMGSGQMQGAGGSFSPNGSAGASRDVYFGTCSRGVCTPHRNIKNSVLIVTTTLSGGQTNTKRYRINV